MIAPPMSTWSRAARFYDLQLPLERRALGVLAGMLDLRAGSRLLDLGTGTGAMLWAAAHVREPPRHVVGVDLAPGMLARVPALPSGWRVTVADAAALPFPDAWADRVSAAYLLQLLDTDGRARVLAEAHRVLAPGGLIATVTVAPPAGRGAQRLRAPFDALAAGSRGVLAGLRGLDPRAELEGAGFVPGHARYVRRGYPSLCVVAARA